MEGDIISIFDIIPFSKSEYITSRVSRLEVNRLGNKQTMILKENLQKKLSHKPDFYSSYWRERNAYKILNNTKAPIPKYIISNRRFLLLEDLGDRTAADIYSNKRKIVLLNATDTIMRFHLTLYKMKEKFSKSLHLPIRNSFKMTNILIDGFEVFLEKIDKLLEIPKKCHFKNVLQMAFDIINLHCTCIVHGDLHPRNMIYKNRTFFITDLEHVRWGIPQQDLFFLRNWELNLDENLIKEILKYYYKRMCNLLHLHNWEEFVYLYNLVTLTESMHAIRFWTIIETNIIRAKYYYRLFLLSYSNLFKSKIFENTDQIKYV
jgi:hypothetical protein